MNKAYCYRTFVQAANSGPQKQGHGTIKAAVLREQKGLVLQGSPKSCPLDLIAFAWKWEDTDKESSAAGKLFKTNLENSSFKGT